MQEVIISGLQSLYGLEPIVGNPYAKIDKNGMHFRITTYAVKGFGHLSVIDMKAMLGLMKMESVILNAETRDLPLYSGDLIRVAGKCTILQEFYNTIAPGLEAYGMSVDWVNMTASQRLYSIPNDQVGEYALCILAEVRGYQYTISGYGFTDTIIVCDVPGYYILICPMADYEEYHDTMFQVFIDNTTTNDQFVSCNEQLTAEITNTVINNMNMVCAASSAYASAMTAMTFDMVESNMNYGTYSSDRFSDYIFDQNDYTLSDGTSVQISTQYDYVYQGDNGVVYYSDSAFDVPPVGATQLYPN